MSDADSVASDATVLESLEAFLDENGLSAFSKTMAKQWITKAMSGGFPPGAADRVLRWLRQQLVGKRAWCVQRIVCNHECSMWLCCAPGAALIPGSGGAPS